MYKIFIFILVASSTCLGLGRADSLVLFDFDRESGLKGWHVESDGVMGGISRGYVALTEEGHARFSGDVSLKNNGGFTSVQSFFDPIDVSDFSRAVLRIKGDGKRYFFRVQSKQSDRYSYVFPFNTTGKWQTVVVPFSRMYPKWRGNPLDLPHYPGESIAHARFLIANGRAESFELLIDWISLK